MASSGTISASANKIFKKSKAGWTLIAVGKGSISFVNPQQIIARNSMGSGGGRVLVSMSYFVRYEKMPNSRLLILSELPVVKHLNSAGSSFSIRVKCHDNGYCNEWCEYIAYIHSHCSTLSLSMRTPSVNKKKSSVRVGRCRFAYPIIMTIAHPPAVVVTLGMVQHGVRTSTLSLGQERVDVDRRRLYQHKDPAQ